LYLFQLTLTPEGLIASLFAWDDNLRVIYQQPGLVLKPGEWQTFSFTLPSFDNVLLSQVGVVFRNIGEAWTGNVLLDELDWSGIPNYSCDFSRERNEYGVISGWTFLRGFWRIDNGAFHGSGAGVSEAYTGDAMWRDYTFTADVVPIVGDQHNVLVRVQGARRSYAFGLAPNHRVALYKNERGYQLISAAPFEWKHGQCYTIQIDVHGAEIVALVNKHELLRWTDSANPFLHGQVGVANVAGHTRIERIAIISKES
jgi:hypothetical protein